MAQPSSIAKPSSSARRGVRLALPWSVALLALLTLGACTPRLFKAKPPPSETFTATIDSVVLNPTNLAPEVQINTVDLGTLRQLLETELKAKQGIRIYPKPPTRLRNTAIVDTTLVRYRIREQTADLFVLRTVDLTLTASAKIGQDTEPTINLRRSIAYQKVYPQGVAIPAPEFDFHNAAQELAAMMAESLVPSDPVDLPLVRAVDQSTNNDESLPFLKKAIDYADHQRDADAQRMWALVLFNPDGNEGGPPQWKNLVPFDPEADAEATFRVSERTLAWLKDRGLDDATLAKLAPMTATKPLELKPFRDEVRKALGGPAALENPVLQLSETKSDRAHLNLYAAHLDLYRMYLRDKRYDVATYHLSRAYAHYPQAELLQAWIKLQTDRGMIPTGVRPGTLFFSYLRIPAPRTALVTAGAFDLAVLPPPAIEDVPDPLPPLVLPKRQLPPDPNAMQLIPSKPRLVPGLQPTNR